MGHSFANNVERNRKKSGLNMTKFLMVDYFLEDFHVEGFGGAVVQNLPVLIDRVCKKAGQRLDILVIEMVSNDLCQYICDVENLAHTMFELAHYARNGHGVKKVYIMGVLPRLKCREVSPEIFEARKTKYNELMKEKTRGDGNIIFHIPKGFWRKSDRSKLPMSKWSSDKIHPGPKPEHDGFRKYKKSLKHVLIAAAGKLHGKPSQNFLIMLINQKHFNFKDNFHKKFKVWPKNLLVGVHNSEQVVTRLCFSVFSGLNLYFCKFPTSLRALPAPMCISFEVRVVNRLGMKVVNRLSL